MTTNQTIDGVPRRLLVEAMWALDNAGIFSTATALRALLDAPACKECEGVGYHVTMGVQRSCWACKPVTQPQGEPVAWKTGSITWAYEPDARRHGEQHGVTVIPLYAEQPAPVEVVIPEREMYCQYLRGVIPDNRLEVEAHKDGWNACLDELKRLNPSL